MVTVAAVAAIHYLGTRADTAYDHEITLAEIRTQLNELSSFEWQLIATRSADPQLLEEIQSLKKGIELKLAEIKRSERDSVVIARVSELYYQYTEAIDRESRLIAAGEVDAAMRLDEEQVDPLFAQLSEETAREVEEDHETYHSAQTWSFFGSAVAAVASALVITFILWIYDRKRKAELLLLAEKTVLVESEEKFRSVAQSTPDAVISIDSQNNIIFWNRGAEVVFGYSEAEAIGKPLTMIMPERYHEKQHAAMGRLTAGGLPKLIGETVEFAGLRRDGSEFPVELSLSSWQLRDELFFTSIIRDITERRKKEDQILTQHAELEEKNSQLWALYEVSALINQEAELAALFDEVLEKLTSLEMFNVERRGGFFLVEGERMRLVSWLEHSDDFLKLHDNMKVGTCLCGLAAEKGKVIWSGNSYEDKRHSISYPGMTAHGHVIIPLKTSGKVLGVLYLYLLPGAMMSKYDLNLLNAIGNQLAVAIEKARLFEETRMLSLHDPLTGLANRNLMEIELTHNIARAKRSERPFSVLMLDLDHFKSYNDTFGHTAGDKLLAEVSDIILKELREVDLAVRYGGEEFLVMLPDTGTGKAVKVAQRIRQKIEHTEFYRPESAKPAHITISIGVASLSEAVPNKDVLISRSDSALYQAKSRGRNRVEVWTPETQPV